MGKRKTHEEFTEQVYSLVGDEYSFLTEYNGSHTKILVRHNECGREYQVEPNSFLAGHGCPKCRKVQGGLKNRVGHEKLENQIRVLGNYEYVLLEKCATTRDKVLIRHNDCGYEYHVRPSSFLRGDRCPNCYGNVRKTREEFAKEVNFLEKGKYIVLGNYSNNRTKILLKHTECGYEYMGTPHDFLGGKRCPYCNSSVGEKRVSLFLRDNNIPYKPQYKFADCKKKNHLVFDFAVFNFDSTLKCLIEYDGELHYREVNFRTSLKERQYNDELKNLYCKQKKVNLIRIPYWDFDNIEAILKSELMRQPMEAVF